MCICALCTYTYMYTKKVTDPMGLELQRIYWRVWERKGKGKYCNYIIISKNNSNSNNNSSPEGRTEAEATERYYLLAYSPWLAELIFLYNPELPDHLLRDGTSHGGLGPSTSIINKENAPQAFLQVKLMGHCLN